MIWGPCAAGPHVRQRFAGLIAEEYSSAGGFMVTPRTVGYPVAASNTLSSSASSSCFNVSHSGHGLHSLQPIALHGCQTLCLNSLTLSLPQCLRSHLYLAAGVDCQQPTTRQARPHTGRKSAVPMIYHQLAFYPPNDGIPIGRIAGWVLNECPIAGFEVYKITRVNPLSRHAMPPRLSEAPARLLPC